MSSENYDSPSAKEEIISYLDNFKRYINNDYDDIDSLVKLAVIHYQFECIHPFYDGNGRIGRMWHTLLLSNWKEILAWLPIETLVKERQTEYYRVLGLSDKNADSSVFVEFMLQTILDALQEVVGIR